LALFVAGIQLAFAAGLAFAGLRHPSGPDLKDPLLISLVLALFAAVAVGSGTNTLVTGIARFGRSGCIKIESPWSYAPGTLSILVGALALYAAASVAIGRGNLD
jgi:hypothetical protein